jgi:uncharacterized protein
MGQLLKVLIISIAITVLLLAIRKMLFGRRGRPETEQASVQSMAKCAHCGMYLPESQAVFEAGKPYCNDEHRRIASGK